MRRPALAQVDLDGVERPAAVDRRGDEVDRRAPDCAAAREHAADARPGVGELAPVVGSRREAAADVLVATLATEDLLMGRDHADLAGRGHEYSSVAAQERGFNPRWDRFRTWRGPSWMNTAWLLVPAMGKLGYGGDAHRVVASLAAAVERSGWREYFHPFTGAGLGARRFGFATLLVELL
jgi:hypothetical protein